MLKELDCSKIILKNQIKRQISSSQSLMLLEKSGMQSSRKQVKRQINFLIKQLKEES